MYNSMRDWSFCQGLFLSQSGSGMMAESKRLGKLPQLEFLKNLYLKGVVPPVPVSFKGLVRMVAVRLLIPPGRWERSGTSSWSIRSTALVNWVKSARILR